MEIPGSGVERMREGGRETITFDLLADVVVETGMVEEWRKTRVQAWNA